MPCKCAEYDWTGVDLKREHHPDCKEPQPEKFPKLQGAVNEGGPVLTWSMLERAKTLRSVRTGDERVSDAYPAPLLSVVGDSDSGPPPGVAGYDPMYNESGEVIGCVASVNGHRMAAPPNPDRDLSDDEKMCCGEMAVACKRGHEQQSCLEPGTAMRECFQDRDGQHWFTFNVEGNPRTFCPYCKTEFPIAY